MLENIGQLAEYAALILAVTGTGLEIVRRKYGKWGDKILAGMKEMRDNANKLALKFPERPTMVKFAQDLGAAYDDANACWASNEWLKWSNLIKASEDFMNVYNDMMVFVSEIADELKALEIRVGPASAPPSVSSSTADSTLADGNASVMMTMPAEAKA